MRSLGAQGHEVRGLDIKAADFTTDVGSITDPEQVRRCMKGVETVFHSATLHKPHVVTHSKQDFVDVNISGTLNLLEAAVDAGVKAFIFTSTTSVFGDALRPAPGEPSVWVTESLTPVPKNIYGVTKTAAENLCQLFHRRHALDCLVLRTSRFFPEQDDDPDQRARHRDANIKVNEFLHRRVDVTDVVSAHLLAAQRARDIGFGRYIISATTPFRPGDVDELRRDPAAVVARRVPGFKTCYEQLGWCVPDTIDRVYDNRAAREDLGWRPQYDFAFVIERLRQGRDHLSPLAQQIGAKGYHDQSFEEGPYPVE